jgi:methionine aminopeptidase
LEARPAVTFPTNRGTRLAAHLEHTIALTPDGPEVFTVA